MCLNVDFKWLCPLKVYIQTQLTIHTAPQHTLNLVALACIIQTLMLPLCNTIGLMLLLYLGWELCVVYNY